MTSASFVPDSPLNVHATFVRQSFCWGRKDRFLYLANAKAGSSNIKRALIRSVLGTGKNLSNTTWPHSAEWWDDPAALCEVERPYTFGIVRNPYTRVLSAYLDKICRAGILREQFYWQHGLPNDLEIGFEAFLELLLKPGSIHDQHYRTQADNLYLGGMHIDLVFPLEDYTRHLDELRGRIPNLVDEYAASPESSAQKHATKSSEKIDRYYSQEAIALVQEVYRADFDAFGYSRHLDERSDPPPPVRDIAPARETYPALILATLATSRKDRSIAADDVVASALASPAEDAFKLALQAKSGDQPLKTLRETMADLADRPLSPVERYVVLDLHSRSLARTRHVTEALDALDEMLKIAPYFAAPQERAMKLLLRSGEEAKAAERLDWLTRMTWQKDRLTGVFQEEREKQANSAASQASAPPQHSEDETDMPEITHKLVQFVASRMAKVDLKTWKELPRETRDGFISQARAALRAERTFFNRQSEQD